jgi:Skp family chaperone for outer membrane proteins
MEFKINSHRGFRILFHSRVINKKGWLSPYSITLCLNICLLSACSSPNTTESPAYTCATIDLQKIASQASEVASAKQKIALQFESKRHKINEMNSKKQELESVLQSDQPLSTQATVALKQELSELNKEISYKNSELETELRSTISSYNRYLNNYLLKVISAKANRDGVDIVYDEHSNIIVNKHRASKINCSNTIQNYTDEIIRVTNP